MVAWKFKGRARHSVRAVTGFTTNDVVQKAVGLIDSYDGVQRTARPTAQRCRFAQIRPTYPKGIVPSSPGLPSQRGYPG